MSLDRYEDIFPLSYKIDSTKAIEELEKLTEWKDEKSRKYVDLIGDPNQTYTGKGGDISLNSVSEKLPTLSKFISEFPSVHKARVHRLNAGSFFEPHRDHFPGQRRFRVLVALNNTELDAYAFIYDRKIFEIIGSGMSVAELSRNTDIRYHSLYNTYTNAKKHIKNKL